MHSLSMATFFYRGVLLWLTMFSQLTHADGFTITDNGKPTATVFHSPANHAAAVTLVEHIREMSGATLPTVQVADREVLPATEAVIVIGHRAAELGCKMAKTSVSKEGFHLLVDGRRLLLNGESPAALQHGVYEILERLGCGYYFDLPLGKVIPKKRTVRLASCDSEQYPSFEMRKIWGSTWSRMTPWKLWNRAGGIDYNTGHAWAKLIPKSKYGEKPEYYPLRGGKRRIGKQLCTSHPEVVRIAGDSVLEEFANGAQSVSMSADDGGGFCECERCRSLDVAGRLEPSSGKVCVSDRFQEFYNAVATRALAKYPNRRINFYAYSDYTRPPARVRTAPPNLMMWIAPIRYCRIHGISEGERCPRRKQLGEEIVDWSKVVRQFGFRTYNYNLAECLAPFSKVHAWRKDLPWLHAKGCRGLNLESINSTTIMAPTQWLSVRLAWDVNADVDALMTRYWTDLFGPTAGVHMGRYWSIIDQAWGQSPTHAGSFICLPKIFTDSVLKAARQALDDAKAVIDDDIQQQRWAIFDAGFVNAEMYMAMHKSLTSGRYKEAGHHYDTLLAHVEKQVEKRWANHYTAGYLKRFVSKTVLQARERTTGDNEHVLTFPDQWRWRYDVENQGEEKSFHGPTEVGEWRDVKTFSATLEEQGIAEQLTFMWYRNGFKLPASFAERPLRVWFGGVDKKVSVWINGKQVMPVLAAEQKRSATEPHIANSGHNRPVEFDITDAVQAGENMIAVKVDHRSLSELSLGGILKPVFVYVPSGRTLSAAD